ALGPCCGLLLSSPSSWGCRPAGDTANRAHPLPHRAGAVFCAGTTRLAAWSYIQGWGGGTFAPWGRGKVWIRCRPALGAGGCRMVGRVKVGAGLDRPLVPGAFMVGRAAPPLTAVPAVTWVRTRRCPGPCLTPARVVGWEWGPEPGPGPVCDCKPDCGCIPGRSPC